MGFYPFLYSVMTLLLYIGLRIWRVPPISL